MELATNVDKTGKEPYLRDWKITGREMKGFVMQRESNIPIAEFCWEETVKCLRKSSQL
jgi:hypothetical protein